MRIGLIDVDGHGKRYPNLALMKICAYHRNKGDSVEFVDPMFGEYDLCYASKIFNFSPDYNYYTNCDVIKGGTGYDVHSTLPHEIDMLQPDYSLYGVPDNYAYGFITRGCPNKCKWCVVPIKEGNVRPYMTIDEITQCGIRNHCILMDNNILASDFGLQQLVEISDKGYRIDLNQGNDARKVTPEIAELFANINWIDGTVRFAADTSKEVDNVIQAINLVDKQCAKLGRPKLRYLVYTMIYGDIRECESRISSLISHSNIRVHAQPFRSIDGVNTIPQWQKDMAHWSNKKQICKSCSFRDFRPRKGFACREYFNYI